MVKWQSGKLPLPLPPAEFITSARTAGGFSTLPIAESAVLHLAKLPALHSDPFDRMLVCQAIDTGSAIVTPDPLIHQYPVRVIWK